MRSINVAATLLWLLGAAQAFAQDPADPVPEKAIRSFSLQGIDGKTVAISPEKLRRPMIVHLFSVQRPGWEQEVLQLKGLYSQLRKNKIALLSIAAYTPKTHGMLADFAAQEDVHFPLAIEGVNGPFAAFAAEKIPRLILIGPDATVRWKAMGGIGQAELDEMSRLIPPLLQERETLLKEDRKRARESHQAQKAFEKAARKVRRVEAKGLRARIEANEPLNLFHIGSKAEYEAGHLPGAVHLEYKDAERFFKDKDQKKEWILYCGCSSELGLSGQLAVSLYLNGFRQAGFLKGHIQEWEKSGFPLVRGDESGGMR
jgi:rhodanese-related sulfurtransferase